MQQGQRLCVRPGGNDGRRPGPRRDRASGHRVPRPGRRHRQGMPADPRGGRRGSAAGGLPGGIHPGTSALVSLPSGDRPGQPRPGHPALPQCGGRARRHHRCAGCRGTGGRLPRRHRHLRPCLGPRRHALQQSGDHRVRRAGAQRAPQAHAHRGGAPGARPRGRPRPAGGRHGRGPARWAHLRRELQPPEPVHVDRRIGPDPGHQLARLPRARNDAAGRARARRRPRCLVHDQGLCAQRRRHRRRRHAGPAPGQR